MIRNPRIVLLDEATSALDTESERLVQEALTRLTQGRTTLIVAHRFSSIRHAHRVVVLHGGRIVETGTQEELMAKQGQFYRLAKLQGGQPAGVPAAASH
jgi:ABC-type multidrug transport system fused ATPase/permease subunit